ncbi:MAG: FAD-binding protein [Defluviitaleaceae bacterium]|nr:FAD-binding protein [Defluviitaleaceae bacterium]
MKDKYNNFNPKCGIEIAMVSESVSTKSDKNRHSQLKSLYHTIVVGSGCAGYNAADWLYGLGVADIAIVTEGINMGTSRNTGSDKQTYYKLTLAGDEPDSIYEMATTLFEGGCVHGDTAMVEAAASVKSFMKLVNLGLPFPTNPYGAHVGYKTDHDPRQRATSCGPLTSKLMTEALEKSVRAKGIPILDNCHVIKLLVEDNRIYGIQIYNDGLKILYAQNIILATGGPAGVYSDTVYPISQTGGTGLALSAGAKACNLQEWQYGLASTDFRWNVSGTYQQVLPRYISVDSQGNEYEFLPAEYHNRVFLKGYQWPFDTRKIPGSSQIDILVAAEINEKGRRVYMDFRRNPTGLKFEELSEEAYDYLAKSDALFGTPIDRLAKMNPKAIKLYKDNGIDLYNEPLRIAVCAQHCNGGIAVDANWESSIKSLYVVGEAAGTFGVYRPGGSALNSAQVGSMRAAEHISRSNILPPASKSTSENPPIIYSTTPTVNRAAGQEAMSKYAAYNRNIDEMRKLYQELSTGKELFFKENTIVSDSEIPYLYKSYDILITQIAVLSAMIFSAEHWGSHGGALVDGKSPRALCFDQVVTTADGKSFFEPVRPLPNCDDWFEKVWNQEEQI